MTVTPFERYKARHNGDSGDSKSECRCGFSVVLDNLHGHFSGAMADFEKFSHTNPAKAEKEWARITTVAQELLDLLGARAKGRQAVLIVAGFLASLDEAAQQQR